MAIAGSDTDTLLRFVSATASHDVGVAQFAVKHACHVFPRIFSGSSGRKETTSDGIPIVRMQLDNLVDMPLERAPPGSITGDILDVFFALVRVMVSRSMSDGVLYDCVARERRRRELETIDRATGYILHLHALALKFMCPRVRMWAVRSIIRLFDEENVPVFCDYILDAATEVGGVIVRGLDVRPGCEALMHQFILWFYCINDAMADTAFNKSVRALLAQVRQRDRFDPFQYAIQVDEAMGVVHVQGCAVRCAACRGSKLAYIDAHQRALHLTSVNGQSLGYWSAYIVDSADAAPSFGIVHVPARVVAAQQTQPSWGADADTHAREDALYRAALATRAEPEQFNSTFCCDVRIGMYRRISRAGLDVPENMVLREAVVVARERTVIDDHQRATSVVSARFSLPTAAAEQSSSQWTWYNGVCHACRTHQPVSILTYRMTIDTRKVAPPTTTT